MVFVGYVAGFNAEYEDVVDAISGCNSNIDGSIFAIN